MQTTITCKCPKCQNELEAPSSLVGHEATCPHCGNVMIVSNTVGKAPKKGSWLSFCLGFFFSIIGVLIAAIIEQRRGVVSALKGFVISLVLGIAGYFSIMYITYESRVLPLKIQYTQNILKNIGLAAEMYKLDMEAEEYELRKVFGNGVYPDSIQQMIDKGSLPDGLYKDAWGTPMQYKREGNVIEIRSAGPDRKMDTMDDITEIFIAK